MRAVLALVGVLFAGCARSSESPAPSEDSGYCPATCGSESGAADAPICTASKIAFSRDDGCNNDDSVEFCLEPSGDASEDATHMATLLSIAPDVRCATGSQGRAGCDGVPLCMLPIDHATCSYLALSEADWARICNLSNLPYVRRIVPTFYE